MHTRTMEIYCSMASHHTIRCGYKKLTLGLCRQSDQKPITYNNIRVRIKDFHSNLSVL
ncbi:hypothetical protein AAZX31_04G013400 [Glycine max]